MPYSKYISRCIIGLSDTFKAKFNETTDCKNSSAVSANVEEYISKIYSMIV